MCPPRLALTVILLAATMAVLPVSGGAAVGPGVALPNGLATDRTTHSSDGILRLSDQRPLDAVLRAIAERVPGRALEARQIERDGRAVYRIKWLGEDGKVRDILADAMTGEIVRVR